MKEEPLPHGFAGAEMFCRQCPLACGALRSASEGRGRCRSPYSPRLARAGVHCGEEPPVSGSRGSGTLFFTGCHLSCLYCQNHEISQLKIQGRAVKEKELASAAERLIQQGVHNINFVSASHFTEPIAQFLEKNPLPVPVVWNCSGYESTESLKRLEGLVQVYLPDYKYSNEKLGRMLSGVPDYPVTALAALKEMLRQTGPYQTDEEGILKKGLLVRHLILPGFMENSLGVIDIIEDHLPRGSFLFSLLGQYTPIRALIEKGRLDAFPSLKRRLLPEEFERVWQYLSFSSLEDGFVQEPEAAGEEAIPSFDGSGLEPFKG